MRSTTREREFELWFRCNRGLSPLHGGALEVDGRFHLKRRDYALTGQWMWIEIGKQIILSRTILFGWRPFCGPSAASTLGRWKNKCLDPERRIEMKHSLSCTNIDRPLPHYWVHETLIQKSFVTWPIKEWTQIIDFLPNGFFYIILPGHQWLFFLFHKY